MDSTLVAAIIGVAGALLGVALTRLFDLLERRAKHQQWLDEFRLPKQIDTLSTLYADAVHLQAQILYLTPTKTYDAVGHDSLESEGAKEKEDDQAYAAYDQYWQSSALAYIYLSEEARAAAFQYAVSAFLAIAATDPDPTLASPQEEFQERQQVALMRHKQLVSLLQEELVATNTRAINHRNT